MVQEMINAAVVVTLWAVGGIGCKVKDTPPITAPWADTFERDDIGRNYYIGTGSLEPSTGYQLKDGALSARGAHNKPLWLRKKLPRDVRIDVTTWSTENRGDLKVEMFGDGKSFDPDGGGYTATGYVFIFGGWYNSKSMIARLDEHGQDVKERLLPKVVPNQKYRWRIERQGKQIRWFVDDMNVPFLSYDDAKPLEDSGHEFFGFNNWETDTWFDNLEITPL
jgi:hypothetical protein